MDEIGFIQLVKDVGPGLGLLGYFVWKDYKFTGKLTELMAEVKNLLQEVRSNKAA